MEKLQLARRVKIFEVHGPNQVTEIKTDADVRGEAVDLVCINS